MATHPVLLDTAEFERLYENQKPAYEYWFGHAVQKPRPTTLHGVLQVVIAMLLDQVGWNTAAEVRLKVIREAQPVLDLIAVRGKLKKSYPTTAPELCVEILSPGDTLTRALKKAHAYIEWGSQAVWIIDPDQRTAWTLSKAGQEWIPPSGSLIAGETAIDLATLFAEVDKKLDLSDED